MGDCETYWHRSSADLVQIRLKDVSNKMRVETMPRRDSGEIFRMTRPSRFAAGMVLFLILAGLVAAAMLDQVLQAFSANIFLNGVILSVLFVGIIYAFIQVFRLAPSVRWIEHYRIDDVGGASPHEFAPPELLAPMAAMLRDRQSSLSLSATALGSILDSIGSRLDESREILRYMIGLLVFLGLLGTFWGLLQTISSVSESIRALTPTGGPSQQIFQDLISSLEGPLKGMAIAFSSSLFGLSGSLVLGFLDLRAGQAQNRFYNELEEYLSTRTQVSIDSFPPSGGGGGGRDQDETLNALYGAIRALEHAVGNLDTRADASGFDLSDDADPTDSILSPQTITPLKPREETRPAVRRLIRRAVKNDDLDDAAADNENRATDKIVRNALTKLRAEKTRASSKTASPLTDWPDAPELDHDQGSLREIRNDIRVLTKTIVSLADRSR
jgi:biopolymer transport protein ExbB/TolQ